MRMLRCTGLFLIAGILFGSQFALAATAQRGGASSSSSSHSSVGNFLTQHASSRKNARLGRSSSSFHSAAPPSSSQSSSIRRHGGGGGGSPSPDSNDEGLVAPSLRFPDMAKDYGDDPFTPSPISNSPGAFTFTSSNTAVATVSGNIVTLTGIGSTVINAIQAASGHFSGDQKSAVLSVGVGTPVITFDDIFKNSNDEPFGVNATSPSGGAITYTGDNDAVATVSGNTVTIHAGGIVTLTAHQAATGNYRATTKDATLTVLGFDMCELLPCDNGGSCLRTSSLDNGFLDSYTCNCTEGFGGSNCDEVVSDANCNLGQCRNDGVCVADTGGGHCECTGGYSGDFCTDLACGDLTCHNMIGFGSECSVDNTCTCAPCYMGADCSIFDVVDCA